MKDNLPAIIIAAIVIIVAIIIFLRVEKKEAGNRPADAPREKPTDIGSWIMFAGVLLGAYAFFVFDVTVETHYDAFNLNGYTPGEFIPQVYDRVVNLGLLDERRNMLMIAGVMVIVGAIFNVNKKKSDGAEKYN